MGGAERNKMERIGGRAETSHSVRRRMRYALKIGPRRNDLSCPHAESEDGE